MHLPTLTSVALLAATSVALLAATSVALLAATVAASGALHRIQDQKHQARDTLSEVDTVIRDNPVPDADTFCEAVEDSTPKNETERLYNGFRDLKISWLDILLCDKDTEHQLNPKFLLAKCLDSFNPMGRMPNPQQEQKWDSQLWVGASTGRPDNDTITLEATPFECQERVRMDLNMFKDGQPAQVTITDRKTEPVFLKTNQNIQTITISGYGAPRLEAFRAIAAGDLTYNEQLRLSITQRKDEGRVKAGISRVAAVFNHALGPGQS